MSASNKNISQPIRRKRRVKLRWIALAIIAIVTVWIAQDLLWPRSSDIRAFDPNEIARLETAMWRSYYAKQRVSLFNELTETLRTQYHLPLVRSNTVAYQAAKAAFVFKDGHNRSEYEKALPCLVKFYTEINDASDTKFDVNRVAQLELEWWIVHRERSKQAPGDLDLALAKLPGRNLSRACSECDETRKTTCRSYDYTRRQSRSRRGDRSRLEAH